MLAALKRRPHAVALALVLSLTVVIGSRGITDESAVMLGGDMARYVMNGVFMYDWVASGGTWSSGDFVRFAEHYYAKYPALSLGHHPPLTSAAAVPFLAAFGVTLQAARLTALMFFVLAVWALYRVGSRLFGWQVGCWAALLFATNVFVLRFGHYLLSEMPMLALMLWAMDALLVYAETGRRRHLMLSCLALVASFYAKQLALLIVPAYILLLVGRAGWQSLRRPPVWVAALASAVLLAPVVVMTKSFALVNVNIAVRSAAALATGQRRTSILTILERIVTTHMSWLMLFLVVLGIIGLLRTRNRAGWILVAWIATVVPGTVVFAGGIEPARYAFSASAAWALLAASIAQSFRSTSGRFARTLLLVCLMAQAWSIRAAQPSAAGGYETAARFVVAESTGQPTVLSDLAVDTGYFVFFVRKHDPAGQLAVLRADKVFPRDAGNLDPASIVQTLQRLGTRYVVIEDGGRRPAGASLRRALAGPEFVERLRIPVTTREPAAQGVSLVAFEFQKAAPGDPDAEVRLDVRLSDRRISVRLGDIVPVLGR